MIGRLRVRIPAGAVGEFSSPESALCADSYSVSVPPPCYRSGTQKTPVILREKNADGWLHLYTHTPLTQRSRSGLTIPLSRQCGSLSGNELTRNSSGNTRSQSSQLGEPLRTDPGLKSGISVRELISIKKKKTLAGGD